MSTKANNDVARFRLAISLICFSICLLVIPAGCKNFIHRGQSPDGLANSLANDRNNDGVRYVSDICSVWGLNYAKIESVALVTQLANTGGDPKPGGTRNTLINAMKSEQIKDPNEILASKETSMVVCRAFLPPGAKKGDRFDIEVRTIDGSKTTSLRGGYMVSARMRPAAVLDNRVRTGHTLGKAEGAILVTSHFDDDDKKSKTRGVILGGGVATDDRELGLAIRSEAHSIKNSTAIESAINRRFSVYDVNGKVGAAVAKNDRNVILRVPNEYKHNMGRYLQVVMSIAYDQPEENNGARIEKLERQLNEPALARATAMKLEAIGPDAIAALRRALSHESLEVRFYAAQSLAYLGNADGVTHLEQAAVKEAAFRWHALTALTSLKDTTAGTALANLMHDESAELRYGAFRSMLTRSPGDPLVEGKRIGEDFHLHVVPSPTTAMLHISRRKRREIVIFNDNQTVSDGFLFIKSGLTAKAIGGGQVEIKSFGRGNQKDKVAVCSNRISEVIEHLGNRGCSYGTIVDMLKESKQYNTLNTRIVINAGPKSDRTYDRNELSANDLPDRDTLIPGGQLPELFREGGDANNPDYDEYRRPVYAEDPENDPEYDSPSKPKRGWLDRIKGKNKP